MQLHPGNAVIPGCVELEVGRTAGQCCQESGEHRNNRSLPSSEALNTSDLFAIVWPTLTAQSCVHPSH